MSPSTRRAYANAQKKKATLSPVPEGKDKIEFSVTFHGEWFFNLDFANNRDTSINYHARECQTFREAFEKLIVRRVYDRTDNVFNASSSFQAAVSLEVEESYKAFRAELTAAERSAVEQELAELKTREAALKAKLGK